MSRRRSVPGVQVVIHDTAPSTRFVVLGCRRCKDGRRHGQACPTCGGTGHVTMPRPVAHGARAA